MNREQALQQIKHHIAAAARHEGARRFQHLESVRYLREQYNLPEPAITKAIPPTEPATDFERLRARLTPHRASKPDWNLTKEYSK